MKKLRQAAGVPARRSTRLARPVPRIFRAFLAIRAPETAALMEQYLADEHFGQLATTVIAEQWGPPMSQETYKKFWNGLDFSRVGGMPSDPHGSSSRNIG